MTRKTLGDRHYSEREMALILKIASEIDQRASPGEGHSLAEIQEIAAEAGISPEVIEEAAQALEAQRASAGAALAGAPTTFRFRRAVDGQIPESELGELVRTVRRLTGRPGTISKVLDSLEFRHEEFEGRNLHVEVTPREGRTRVQVTGRYDGYAVWTYAKAAILATIASVVAAQEMHAAWPVELGAVLSIWGVSMVGARTLWRRIASKTEGRLRDLADTLASQIAAAMGTSRRELGAPEVTAADEHPEGP